MDPESVWALLPRVWSEAWWHHRAGILAAKGQSAAPCKSRDNSHSQRQPDAEDPVGHPHTTVTLDVDKQGALREGYDVHEVADYALRCFLGLLLSIECY